MMVLEERLPREERTVAVWLRGAQSCLQDEERLPQATLSRVCSREPKPWAPEVSGSVGPKPRRNHGQPWGWGIAASAAGCCGTR